VKESDVDDTLRQKFFAVVSFCLGVFFGSGGGMSCLIDLFGCPFDEDRYHLFVSGIVMRRETFAARVKVETSFDRVLNNTLITEITHTPRLLYTLS
jgi:hypothetical protein